MSTVLDYEDYLAGTVCLTCYEVDRLLDLGESAANVAKRMGRARETIYRHLREHNPAILARYTAAPTTRIDPRRGRAAL